MRQHIGGIGLSSENMIFHNKKLWFTESENNKLYYYDLIENRVVLYYIFENEYESRLFASLLIVDNWLVCIPFSATGIYMIEMTTREVKYIPVKTKNLDVENFNQVFPKFMDATVFNNRIYMVGTFYPVIVEYDIALNKLNFFDGWYKDASAYFNSSEDAMVRKIAAVNEKLYAPLCKGNAILEFDMETHISKVHQVGDNRCNYSAACYDGDNLWLAPRNNGGVVKWNIETDEYYAYKQYPEELNMPNNSFNDIYCDEDKNIIFVPGNANMFLNYNKQTNQILEYDKVLRGFASVGMARNSRGKFLFSLEENLLAEKRETDYTYYYLENIENVEKFFHIFF